MNILLHPSSWSDRADDEAENDILQMEEEAASGPKPTQTAPQGPGDPFQFINNLGGSGTNSMATSPSGSQPSISGGKPGGPGQDTSRVSTSSHVVKRHKCDGVRRLVAHPHLPLYISGGQDGAVSIWEWSHTTQVGKIFLFSVSNLMISSGCNSQTGRNICQGQQDSFYSTGKQVWRL